MKTITKKDLIDRITAKTGEKRAAVKRIVQEFLEQIGGDLAAGNRIEFRDFGVFEVRQRAPRTAQNPKTLQPVQVPGRPTVRFKPGRQMRDSIENGDARIVEVRPTGKRARKAEVHVRTGGARVASSDDGRGPKGTTRD